MGRVIIFTAVLLLWWVLAHFIYAFTMLDWVWFTKWEPQSRGVNLFLSTYAAFMAAASVRMRIRK